jgi:large subunit ribosomal protein L30
MSKLKVTLVKGFSGRTQRQRLTVKGLGLSRVHQTVEVQDTPQTRGMISKVIHMITVEEIKE